MKQLKITLALSLAVLLGVFSFSPALAGAAPVWQLTSKAVTRATPETAFPLAIVAKNVGDAPTDATGTLDLTLPAGIVGESLSGPFEQPLNSWTCTDPAGASIVHCDLLTPLSPGEKAETIELRLRAQPGFSGIVTPELQIAGGGGDPNTITDSIDISPTPKFGIDAFDGAVSADSSGASYTQAGGHPFEAATTFSLNRTIDSVGNVIPDGGQINDVQVDLPAGFIGNPSAIATCPIDAFLDTAEGFTCPESSQAGIAQVTVGFGRLEIQLGDIGPTFPLYNLPPSPGVAASFGFTAANVPIFLDAHVSAEGGYHVQVDVRDTSQTLAVLGTSVTLWGTPGDPSHNALRGCKGEVFGGCSIEGGQEVFLTTPTACTPAHQGLTTVLRANSWASPDEFVEAAFESHNPHGYTLETPLTPDQWGPPQGPTGCDRVPFDPEVSFQPTAHEADAPTGLNVDLSVPTDGLLNPGGIAQSNLKQAVVTLPEGMSVNPASASGLGSCAPEQIRLGTDLGLKAGEPNCPDNAKIGTVKIDTPLLEEPLDGSVYLAKQDDNPFNSLLALYIVVKSPERGIIVKLAGKVAPNPVTGQLQTSFDDNPQVPFENLHLELFDGPRAPLITPPTCGTHTTTAQLSPWARPNQPVILTSSFQITSGPGGGSCPAPGDFNPAFEAGTLSPIAGSYSPLIVNASRPDGSQVLRGLNLDLPQGLIGKLAGVPYCPQAALEATASKSGQAELASPSCPAASKVGTVGVGAGPGPTPFHVQGSAYLTGPYKGAPLSLAVITPAVAGPFDLGVVVVRAALRVDPATAQIHAVSDPIPMILQGIPLQVKSVAVNTNKPNFTLNPTSCDPMSFAGTLFGPSSSKAVASHFQLTNCAALGFAPKLDLKLSGGTKRGDNPALRATVTYPTKGAYANIDRVSVALPHSEFLDQSHIRTVCTRVQFAAKACPAASVYGYAKATTPLLDKPLEGPVYLRSSSNPLPDLVAALHGQIDVDLAGRIDSINGGIRNTFDVVPDAPVSKFTLTMKGGAKGLLENSRNLCSKPAYAVAKFRGQNGKRADEKPELKSDCPKKGKARRR